MNKTKSIKITIETKSDNQVFNATFYSSSKQSLTQTVEDAMYHLDLLKYKYQNQEIREKVEQGEQQWENWRK